MAKVGDLPGVQKKLASLGGPAEMTPHLHALLNVDVPDDDPEFAATVDAQVSALVPKLSRTGLDIRGERRAAAGREALIGQGLDPASGVPLQGPRDASGKPLGSLYRSFDDEARNDIWSQQGPSTKVLMQGAAGVVASTPWKVSTGDVNVPFIGPTGGGMFHVPAFSTDASRVPPPSNLAENVARGAGGGATLLGESAGLESVGVPPSLAFGLSTAAQQGQTTTQRIVGGLTSTAAAWLSRFVPARVARAVTGGYTGEVASREAAAAAAGRVANEQLQIGLDAGLSQPEAEQFAAKAVRSAVQATGRLSATEGGQATASRVAGAVAGAATGTVAFGAAEPTVRAWALQHLGEDVQPPTGEDIAKNLTALGVINLLHLPGMIGQIPLGDARPPAAEPADPLLLGPGGEPAPESPAGGGNGAGGGDGGPLALLPPHVPDAGGAGAPRGAGGSVTPESARPATPAPPTARQRAKLAERVQPDAMPVVRGILKAFKNQQANPLDQNRTPSDSIEQRAAAYLPADRPATAAEARTAFSRAASEVKALGWIHESITPPPMPAAATPEQRQALEQASTQQSNALTDTFRGRDLELGNGDTRVRMRVLGVFAYPWDADQIRVMGVDHATNTAVAFRARDLDELKSLTTGISAPRADMLRGEAGQRAPKPVRASAQAQAPEVHMPATVEPEPALAPTVENIPGNIPAPAPAPAEKSVAKPKKQVVDAERPLPYAPTPEHVSQMAEVLNEANQSKSNALLIPAGSSAHFEQQLEADGWARQAEGKRETWAKGGRSLFLRSQGPDAGIIVQWSADEPSAPPKAKKAAAAAPAALEIPPADEAPSAPEQGLGEPKAAPRRLKQGDRVGVPSVWKKGPERRKGSVLGYVQHGDTEKVLVSVRRGKSDVPIEYGEHLVRKLPKIDRRPLSVRKPELVDAARKAMTGLSRGQMHEVVRGLAEQTEAVDQERYQALVDARSAPPGERDEHQRRYASAGRRHRLLRDQFTAAQHVIYETETEHLETFRQAVLRHAGGEAPHLAQDVFEDRVEQVWERTQMLRGMVEEARRAKAPPALLAPEVERLKRLEQLLEPRALGLRLAKGDASWRAWAADVREALGEENPMDYGASTLSMFGTGPVARLVAAKFFANMGGAVRAYERGLGNRGRTVRMVDQHGNIVANRRVEFQVDPDRQFLTYKLMRHAQLGAATAFPPKLVRSGYVMRAEGAHLEGWAHDRLNEALGADGIRWLGHAWSRNSQALFRVLDGKAAPETLPPVARAAAERIRELWDTMLELAQKRAGRLDMKKPGKLSNYATHIRTGLAPEAVDPLINVLWPKTKTDAAELETARNRYFEHREGDEPYIEYFTPVFEAYVRTWARWMATAPFVKVAQQELYKLREPGRSSRRQKAVANIIKSWVFPEKDHVEKGLDEAIRWGFYSRTSGAIESITADEAAFHLGETPKDLAARRITDENGEEQPLKEFVVVKKGDRVRFTTKTPWLRLGELKGGAAIYGGHRGYAHNPDGPLQRSVFERLGRLKAELSARSRSKGQIRPEALLEEMLERREDIRRFERDPAKMMLGRLAHNNLRAVLGYNLRAALGNLVGGAMTTYMEWGAAPFFRGIGAGGRAALQAAYRRYLTWARDRSHLTEADFKAAMESMPLLLEEILPEALGAVPGEIQQVRKRMQQLEDPGSARVEKVMDALGPMRPFGIAESWNRGFDAAVAIMVAQRMGLTHRAVREHYDATEEGKRALMRDVLADMNDPSTISAFIVWQQAFTQFYYDMFGQPTYMSSTTGRLLGQLTTYPIAYGFHFLGRPTEGAARTAYAFFRGLTGAGGAGGGGEEPPRNTGPPEEFEPEPRGFFEKAAARGGARWSHRHAFGVFVRQIALFGAMLTLSSWLAINVFAFGAPIIAAMGLGLLSWLFPNNKDLKSVWNDAKWGLVAVASSFTGIAPAWILGGFSFLVTQGDGMLELLRRQLSGVEVEMKRIIEEFPELFDRPGLRWTYDALNQKTALYDMPLEKKLQHHFGLMPHAEAAHYRKRIHRPVPKEKAAPSRDDLLFQPA